MKCKLTFKRDPITDEKTIAVTFFADDRIYITGVRGACDADWIELRADAIAKARRRLEPIPEPEEVEI